MSTIANARNASRAPIVAPHRAPRVVHVALAGCGTVGASLVALVQREQAPCAARHGVRFEFTRILVRDPDKDRGIEMSPDLFTSSVDDFLAADADVVIEVIGGLNPAGRIARAALDAGRHLVTANKALIARYGIELQQQAVARDATLNFEAAVGGGVPVVRTLRSALGGHGVRSITGILNGTTNYLLTAIADGATFSDALADAQAKGFAEADPTRDLQGLDALDKIRILAWLAWDVDPSEQRAIIEPLPANPEGPVREAAERRDVLKYLAGATRGDDGVVRVWVRPSAVPRDHPFARVRNEENAVRIDSDSLGVLYLQGRGAGGDATASAVLGDLLEAARAAA